MDLNGTYNSGTYYLYFFVAEVWIRVGLLAWCLHPYLSSSFSSSLPSSHSFLSLLLQSGMTHQYCCGAYRKCRFDRPVERQHSSSSDMRMHCWTTAREHSQHFDDITHPHSQLPPPSVCCWNKLALSHSERKEQASVKEQELARKRRGRPWANREGESFWGRRRVADGASGLGLAHTYIHRKRRGEGILLHIVKTSIVHCSTAVFSHIRSKSSHAVGSFAFLDFSVLKWGWGILWTGKWAAGAGVEYFSN